MLIFSNFSSSTGAYRVFAKDPLDIHSSIDDDDGEDDNKLTI